MFFAGKAESRFYNQMLPNNIRRKVILLRKILTSKPITNFDLQQTLNLQLLTFNLSNFLSFQPPSGLKNR